MHSQLFQPVTRMIRAQIMQKQQPNQINTKARCKNAQIVNDASIKCLKTRNSSCSRCLSSRPRWNICRSQDVTEPLKYMLKLVTIATRSKNCSSCSLSVNALTISVTIDLRRHTLQTQEYQFASYVPSTETALTGQQLWRELSCHWDSARLLVNSLHVHSRNPIIDAADTVYFIVLCRVNPAVTCHGTQPRLHSETLWYPKVNSVHRRYRNVPQQSSSIMCRVVHTISRYFEPFCHGPPVWQTNRQTELQWQWRCLPHHMPRN